MNEAFWDSRYNEEDLAYGYDANAYLREALAQHLPTTTSDKPLSVLCLAEGQGRNALYIAKQYPHAKKVIAVDYSTIGVKTTNDLATKEGVSDRLVAYVADLNDYDLLTHCPTEGGYDLIISIFAHTPSIIRQKVHAKLADTLSSNGLFILQAYTPANIGRGTGGPQAPDFCMTKEGLLSEIQGLTVVECEEKEAIVEEGKYHHGLSAVVQGIWQKK